MRSASVDFPWSMWAMIEKLRMFWAGRVTARSRLEPPAEAACDETADLARLLHTERECRGGVHDHAGGDRDAERGDLSRQRAPECPVEDVPDPIGDGRQAHGRDQHLHH